MAAASSAIAPQSRRQASDIALRRPACASTTLSMRALPARTPCARHLNTPSEPARGSSYRPRPLQRGAQQRHHRWLYQSFHHSLLVARGAPVISPSQLNPRGQLSWDVWRAGTFELTWDVSVKQPDRPTGSTVGGGPRLAGQSWAQCPPMASCAVGHATREANRVHMRNKLILWGAHLAVSYCPSTPTAHRAAAAPAGTGAIRATPRQAPPPAASPCPPAPSRRPRSSWRHRR
eukprot:COSAG03_NODE_1776_length_3508_cov_8.950276_2_plen_233_part_00